MTYPKFSLMVFLSNIANVLALDQAAAFDISAKFQPLSLAFNEAADLV